ncbi:MAG: type IV pilin protein [Proteobacteria bacterium]|nr:type IV pilin protein [Pseudomonadota bacterium]
MRKPKLPMFQPRRRPGRAFTLIEMLIVLVLVAILASVALPSYNAYLRRAHRAKARSALLQAAHRLEREATASGSFANAEVPEALSSVPGGQYAISRQPPLDAVDAASRFMLRATPQGAQADDACGTFTLSSTGERGLQGNQAKVADCWNR